MVNKSPVVLSDLSALIGSLQELYYKIATLRQQHRLERKAVATTGSAGIRIAQALRTHIDAIPRNHATTPFSALDTTPETSIRPEHPNRTSNAASGASASEELTGWLREHRHAPPCEANLGQEVMARAAEHINQAMSLCRQGNSQAARMHADLAENAVKTAAQYMPADEFREWEQRLQVHLDAITAPRQVR